MEHFEFRLCHELDEPLVFLAQRGNLAMARQHATALMAHYAGYDRAEIWRGMKLMQILDKAA